MLFEEKYNDKLTILKNLFSNQKICLPIYRILILIIVIIIINIDLGHLDLLYKLVLLAFNVGIVLWVLNQNVLDHFWLFNFTESDFYNEVFNVLIQFFQSEETASDPKVNQYVSIWS